jgi:hypothetical protein
MVIYDLMAGGIFCISHFKAVFGNYFPFTIQVYELAKKMPQNQKKRYFRANGKWSWL